GARAGFGGVFLRKGNAGTGESGHACNERERDRVAKLGGLQGHLSLQVILGLIPMGTLPERVKKDAKPGKVAADTSCTRAKIKVLLSPNFRSTEIAGDRRC